MNERRKTDSLIWYFMVTSVSVIILGGGAWANNINQKVDKVANLEATVQYMQRDISEIKDIIKTWVTRSEP